MHPNTKNTVPNFHYTLKRALKFMENKITDLQIQTSIDNTHHRKSYGIVEIDDTYFTIHETICTGVDKCTFVVSEDHRREINTRAFSYYTKYLEPRQIVDTVYIAEFIAKKKTHTYYCI